MLNTNLATRPFYNQTAVRVWLAAAALVVIVATVFNVWEWFSYVRSDAALEAQAAADEAKAAELRQNAVRLRSSVDANQIQAIASDALQANDLIDRRIFSWTDLFNRFEVTIPAGVRITSVRHRVDKDRGSVLTVAVLARGVGDINAFLDSLENDGGFADLIAHDETMTDDGDIEAVIETVYRPAPGKPLVPHRTGRRANASGAGSGKAGSSGRAAARNAANGGAR
jgi:Tfp pilus assembly protein PilN